MSSDSAKGTQPQQEINDVSQSCPRQREEATDYGPVVARFNPDWRVIVCRDGIQWILQRRAGTRHGQPRWDGRRYCRTRAALLAFVRDLVGAVEASALAALESLPQRMAGHF